MNKAVAQQTAIDLAKTFLSSVAHTTYAPCASDADDLADFIETLTARLEKTN